MSVLLSRRAKRTKEKDDKQKTDITEDEKLVTSDKMTEKNKKGTKNSEERELEVVSSSNDTDSDSEDYSDAEEEWVCRICKKSFSDQNSKIIECERCEDRYCAPCLGLKASEYRVMTTRKDIHWFCPPCEPKAKKSWEQDRLMDRKLAEFETKIMDKMTKMEEKMTEKMLELCSNVTTVEDKPGGLWEIAQPKQKGNGYSQAVKQNLPTVQTGNTDLVTDIVRTVIKETGLSKTSETQKQGMLNRENNLIIHRVTESTNENQEMRRKDDELFFEKLCTEALGIGKIEPEKVFRLGPPQTEKSRPIKIVMRNIEDKVAIMRSLRNLQEAEEPYKAISVTNDLTQEERVENRNLVAEAKKRTEEENSGEFVFKVRGPPWDRRVVKLKKGDVK